MRRAAALTAILLLGLLASQTLPVLLGPVPASVKFLQQALTMTLLAFIMIQVGREFDVELGRKKEYLVDYGVAATAAAFPWLFVTAYFLLFLMPETPTTERAPWIEALLAGRFAAPTSAGVLFSMLAAAGLSATWAFKKTRILAIFDDLDTVLFMIPLKALMVGLAWQLGAVIFVMTTLLLLGWFFYRKLKWPTNWPWILAYSLVITALSEIVYAITQDPRTLVGVHIEVLLPAFLLGCALGRTSHENVIVPGENPHGMSREELVGVVVSSGFMFLVGLSMPSALGPNPEIVIDLSPMELTLHVLAVTILANLGKMFALFCYKKEATLKERLAVSVALFPRGEVGAGVLAISLSYGIKGPFVAVGFLSLALNLVLTAFFILIVRQLLLPPRTTPATKEKESFSEVSPF